MGSADSKIKAIQSANMIYSISTSSQPTYIHQYRKSTNDTTDNYYVYGTLLGNIGLLNLEKEAKPKILWEVENINKSEVVSIRTFDVNFDGK